MTADEKNWMITVVRWTEQLLLENCALKVVLESHRVAAQTYERECKELMASKTISEHVHAEFANLYAGIESTPDPSKALEALAQGLPMPDRSTMS